jgi:GntR family transcriptional repressor for pyruvate dehydrogenase complex
MSAVDKAFHGLRHMIATGRLVAGQRIPPEKDLCEELGVSRGSLREAVRMLAALRVIEPRHGSGTYVSQLRPEDIVGSLSLTVDLLPLTGLLQMYELRRVLEAHAAAQAAARLTPETLRMIFEHMEAMEATEDPSNVSALDHSFHAEIARIGGNPTLESLLGVFRARSRAYQVFTLPEGPHIKRASDEDHRAIATAIANRDPVAAAAAASAHVAHTEKWLHAFLSHVTEADRLSTSD